MERASRKTPEITLRIHRTLLVVLQDQISCPLLLDDHCYVLPAFRILPEFDWLCELLILPLPTLSFHLHGNMNLSPSSTTRTSFALVRFTQTSGA